MTGTDLSLLAEELRKAQEVLAKIKEMKQGAIGDTRITVQASTASTLSTVSIPFLATILSRIFHNNYQFFYLPIYCKKLILVTSAFELYTLFSLFKAVCALNLYNVE